MGCPEGKPCEKLGSLSFFFYAGCPQGGGGGGGRACLNMGSLATVPRSGSGTFFFFFVVVTNLHTNLFIKLCPLLEGMYCSDCLQTKRPNENLLLARISRGREPPQPYLCDVKSSFDLFVNPGFNSALSWWRPYCLQVLDSTTPFSKRKLTLLKRQMERITSKKHSTVKTVEIGEFLAKESCFF